MYKYLLSPSKSSRDFSLSQMCRYLFHIKLSGRLVGQQQPWRSHHIRAAHARAREITSFVQPPHTSASNLRACAHHPSPSVTLLLRPSGAFSPISRANQGTRSEGFASLVTLCDLPHYNAGFPIDRHILLRPRNIPSHRLSMVQPITASAVHTSSSLFLSHNQFAETFHPCQLITTVGGSVTGSRNQQLPCPIVLSPLRTHLQCWYPVLCVVFTNTPDNSTLVVRRLGTSTSVRARTVFSSHFLK